MTDTTVSSAVDEAEFVKVRSIGSLEYVQVWHGGTTVNVYAVTGETWEEVTMWSISDSRGRPVNQPKVEKHMCIHFANLMDDTYGNADEGGRDA